MERLLKWIDEFDDLVAVTRLQAGPLALSLLLLAVLLAVVAAVMVLGPPDLLATP